MAIPGLPALAGDIIINAVAIATQDVLSILAEDIKVFLDLKLFDIPTTVGKAGRVIGIDVSPGEIERAKSLAAIYARGQTIEYRCTPLERADELGMG